MEHIPPYDFAKYTFATRAAVVACSSFELLLVLFGSLADSGFFAKLIYFLFLGASAAVSAHNLALNVDGREEIKKLLSSSDNEVRGRSAVLLAAPAVAGILVFLTVSGHAFFSLFVLIHVLASVGQLAIEGNEVRGCSGGAPGPAPVDQSPAPLEQSAPPTAGSQMNTAIPGQ